MAFARVVGFEGVTAERIEQLREEMSGGPPPEDLPVTEGIVLWDPEAQKSLAILFFETEEDYARGDATLNAMDPGETPGRRTSVGKYEVAIRMSV
jgi:hypothetical protein